MAIAPKDAGGEIGVQIGHVWMGSHRALPDCPEDISYAPVVVVYGSPRNGTRVVFPLNPIYSALMRDRLRLLSAEQPRPKTAGERYKATHDRNGLTFPMDDDAGLFIAGVHASPGDLGDGAAGSISFRSHGIDGVECVAFSREEFATLADVLTRAIDTFGGRPEACGTCGEFGCDCPAN